MTRVAVLQTNFLPWRGYFDLLHDVDLWVVYDTAQYTRQDWRNRNRILLDGRLHWLSVPVRHAPLGTPIREVRVDGRRPWQRDLWRALEAAYRRAPYRTWTLDLLAPALAGSGAQPFERLTDLNLFLLDRVSGALGLDRPRVDAAVLALEGDPSRRVAAAVKAVGGTEYLSGPRGRGYLDPEAFRELGLGLRFKEYGPYPTYAQSSPDFQPMVSVVDLLFHTGPSAARYIWGAP